jgi:predicted Zn-dependent peptidase
MNQLELALWLESDRMGFLLDHAGEDTFKSQRDVVKNERRQRYENAPYGLVRPTMLEEIYPKGNPYHLPTIGSMADLDAATLADVQAFFRKNYVPNNATLAISGDFDKAKATALVEKYFAPIPKGDAVVHAKAMPIPAHGETRIDMEANVELPRVYITWTSPASFAAGDADLDIVGQVLSNGKTSRLHKRLVYDMQIAQSVGAYQDGNELGGEFAIVATAKPGHTADELLGVIDEELVKLRKDGVTEAELTRVKASLNSDNIFELESGSNRADRLNGYNHYVGEPNFLGKDIARFAMASTARVSDAARTYLKDHERVIAVVSVKKDAPVCGKLVNVKRDPAFAQPAAPAAPAPAAAPAAPAAAAAPAAPHASNEVSTSAKAKAGVK